LGAEKECYCPKSRLNFCLSKARLEFFFSSSSYFSASL